MNLFAFFYKWIAGSRPDFVNQFKNNETLCKQAGDYWSKLENCSAIILIIFLVWGIVMVFLYYQPYNNCPGRHYKPKYWLRFLAGTFVLALLFTWICLHLVVPSSLNGVTILHLRLALGNAIYASVLYVVGSWIWCQFNLPTNACRILKK